MTINEKFERYEQLKLQAKELEKEMDALKPDIVAAVPEGKDIAGQYGTFKVQSRATWKYSPTHKQQKEALKDLEEEEKAKGIAVASYTEVLYYTVNEEN